MIMWNKISNLHVDGIYHACLLWMHFEFIQYIYQFFSGHTKAWFGALLLNDDLRWVGANRPLEPGYTKFNVAVSGTDSCYTVANDGDWYEADCDDVHAYICEGGEWGEGR